VTSLMAFVGAVALVGAVVLAVSLRHPAPVRATRQRLTPAQSWARATKRPPGAAGRRRDLILLVSLGGGFVAFLLTGWLVAIAAVPVATLLPKLLGKAPPSDTQLLEALDRWVRSLATTMPAGRDVLQAIRAARDSAPPLIAAEVGLLVDRLDRRWEATVALQRFADALDNSESDAVVMSLMLATRRTEGVRANMLAIADGLQERLRATRTVESERAKPRQVARIVTVLSALLIGMTAFLGHGYFAPYSTPVGQVVITVLVGGYIASLAVLYKMAVPRRRGRILVTMEQVR
jgi:tight adherence protein B